MITLDPVNCENVSVMHSGAPTETKIEKRRRSKKERSRVGGRKEKKE